MKGDHLSLLVVLIVLASNEVLANNNSSTPKLRRSDFPEDFIFGSATSAYQVPFFWFLLIKKKFRLLVRDFCFFVREFMGSFFFYTS